eukprot:1146864-Pelagomonas_calceolata.AAC.3
MPKYLDLPITFFATLPDLVLQNGWQRSLSILTPHDCVCMYSLIQNTRLMLSYNSLQLAQSPCKCFKAPTLPKRYASKWSLVSETCTHAFKHAGTTAPFLSRA